RCYWNSSPAPSTARPSLPPGAHHTPPLLAQTAAALVPRGLRTRVASGLGLLGLGDDIRGRLIEAALRLLAQRRLGRLEVRHLEGIARVRRLEAGRNLQRRRAGRLRVPLGAFAHEIGVLLPERVAPGRGTH